MSSPAPHIDDIDEAAYWQHVDELAETLLSEPATRMHIAVLAALVGGDRVEQLLDDDLELVAELAEIGLVEHGLPTELGRDVAAAAGR